MCVASAAAMRFPWAAPVPEEPEPLTGGAAGLRKLLTDYGVRSKLEGWK